MKAKERTKHWQQQKGWERQDLPAAETKLFKAHEWKLCWRDEPKRLAVVHRSHPKPDWAQYEWVPVRHALLEDVACRAVLRVFVANGWEAEQIDDALGTTVQAWADNPQRLSWTTESGGGGSNELMDAYNAVRAHLSAGGRLRDVPLQTVELVYNTFGAQLWNHVIDLEQREFGPFPPDWRDLVGDTWSPGRPEAEMPKLTTPTAKVVH